MSVFTSATILPPGTGGLDERRHAGGVIHRTVVNGIAVYRLAHAEVIKVCGDNDVLMLQLRISPK
jgi:hypothetical protein